MLSQISARLRGIFGKSKHDAELDDEVREHLSLAEQEHLRRGLTETEARHAARRDFGGVEQVKEIYRERRGLPVLETFLQDLRFGARMLRKNSGFAIVAILTLALGIGANSAIFSLVNGVLLKPLPYSDPGRLVKLWNIGMPKGAMLALKDRMKTVDIAGFTWNDGWNITGLNEPLRLNGSRISPEVFSMLGVHPEIGRAFRADDQPPAQAHVVILSHGLWLRLFGGDASALGRSITIEGTPCEIVGVMPAGFRFPDPQTDFLLPITNEPTASTLWGGFAYGALGRLNPGVTLEQARAEYRTLIPQIVKLYPWPMPTHYAEWTTVTPLTESLVARVQTKLYLLLGAVGLVLLIACANVANLMLTRASSRQKEIAVRRALGAGRIRLVRQMLTESVLLAAGGGAVGLAISWAGLAGLKSALPSDTPRLAEATLDWRVLAFTALLALLTGLVFGLAPALRASQTDIEPALRGSSKSGVGRGRRKLSSALVVSESALMVVLMVSAGLLLKSLYQLAHMNTGVRTDSILTAVVTPQVKLCSQGNECVQFFNELVERASALPGMESAAFADKVPLDGSNFTTLAVENRPEFTSSSPLSSYEFTVSPGFLRTFGIPLLAGRDFRDSDRVGAAGVVIVSRTLANYVWPGQDPVGQHIKPSWEKDWFTVVGVVADVREFAVYPEGAQARLTGDIYFPAAQGVMFPLDDGRLIVRTRSNPEQLAVSIRETVAALRSDVPVSNIRTMDAIFSDAVSAPRSTASLFTLFAALALTLGAIGIYSVVSYSVAERTQEIGVRLAIGAQRGDVLRLVLGQGMRLVVAGIALGIAVSIAATRLMAGLLYGVGPTDIATYVSVTMLLALVAALACYVPARRAMRVDPVIALRYE
ncbi:MAG TPA: ABC transporter permease [Candidatus Acidoferrum sp.]|nr:ABC transporter permease [Candidatus Acidoferrum sp.]